MVGDMADSLLSAARHPALAPLHELAHLELLRRVQGEPLGGDRGGSAGRSAPLVDGDLRLDVDARRATLADRPLALTVREFDLLAFLIAHPGTAFTRAELLERVWGWDFGDQSTVTVHVRRLREKIEPDPARPVRIATVWGVGYRYDPASHDPASHDPASHDPAEPADGG